MYVKYSDIGPHYVCMLSEFSCLYACRLNLRLDLECAGSVASLERLSGLCSSLSCARDQRKAAVEVLQAKHARIQEFAQVAVRWIVTFKD